MRLRDQSTNLEVLSVSLNSPYMHRYITSNTHPTWTQKQLRWNISFLIKYPQPVLASQPLWLVLSFFYQCEFVVCASSFPLSRRLTGWLSSSSDGQSSSEGGGTEVTGLKFRVCVFGMQQQQVSYTRESWERVSRGKLPCLNLRCSAEIRLSDCRLARQISLIFFSWSLCIYVFSKES